jgi:hypothetical protein
MTVKTRFLLSALIIVSGIVFFNIPLCPAQPKVFATNPPDEAIGVRPDFDTIYVIFDKPMKWPTLNPSTHCGTISTNWPAGAVVQWDDNIFHITRSNPGKNLPLGATIKGTLNPPGASKDCFQDTEGNMLPTTHFSFTVRQHGDDPPIEPQVVSTDPPDGATGIDPNISSVSITFNEPMAETSPLLGWIYLSHGWGPSTMSWSPDRTTLTLTRENAGTPLPSGESVVFVLNPDLYNQLRDAEGNVLAEYSYSFTIAGDLEAQIESMYNVTITRIPPNPDKGFYWPYYLSVPNGLTNPAHLFVAPNNTGYDAYDHVLHDVTARETLYWQTGIVHNWPLSSPILVPTFPRYPGLYFQSLGPVAFRKHDEKELRRMDLQLVAMLEDAKERLRSADHKIYDKVLMMGFSASGSFTNMFSFVHPEIIRACSIGGGIPIVLYREGPAWKFRAEKVYNFETLTGNPFNLAAYRKVPQYIYIGDQDGNYNIDDWEYAKGKYGLMRADAQFEIYSGVGHQYTPDILTDLGNFYSQNTDPREVQLFSPNGGETLRSGESPLIDWGGPAAAAKVILKYTKDGGSTWKTITTLTGNPGSYPWPVPSVTSKKTKCKVMVVLKDADGKTIGTDTSNKYFTIDKPLP